MSPSTLLAGVQSDAATVEIRPEVMQPIHDMVKTPGHVPEELCIPAEILPHFPGWPLCCYDNTLTKNSVERKWVYL